MYSFQNSIAVFSSDKIINFRKGFINGIIEKSANSKNISVIDYNEQNKSLINSLNSDSICIFSTNTTKINFVPSYFFVIDESEIHLQKTNIETNNSIIRKIWLSNGEFSLAPNRIKLIKNKWFIKEAASAIILAGGQSSRMGYINKSLLKINGIPMIQFIAQQLENHFDEIIIGANEPELYPFLPYRIIPDLAKGQGPLMGILSCLKASNSSLNFITACDIPVINTNLIHYMFSFASGFDIVMPKDNNNKTEPLFAVYSKNNIEFAEKVINENKRKIVEILQFANTKFIDFDDNLWYKNLNTNNDYLEFIQENIIKK
ncbi:MAG: molybdenum cofactor guanylyltransferase [Bacteroidales bacterium]|nr:molybdenum cofactor guanylyltransferase [Bacteroidales bacterium]